MTQKSSNLVVYPGEETGTSLTARSTFMAEIVTRQRDVCTDPELEIKRKAMLTQFRPLIESLEHIQTLVVKTEPRIKELNAAVGSLATTDAEAVKNRAKLVQAQKSLESLIDSYNAWVMAHPK